ncbi:LOW QUALITY PROTEIN: hypothetical protein ACHAW6_003716 [Cyclotella cf. meneghiniana]
MLECMSRVFGIGLNAAKTTLAMTTQRGGKWYLDHMMARKKSLNQNTGAWVLPMEIIAKSTWYDHVASALDSLCDDIGIPEKLKMDRAPELVGKETDFYKWQRRDMLVLITPSQNDITRLRQLILR